MARNAASKRLRFLDGASRAAEPAIGNVDDIRFQDALVRDVDPSGARRIPAGCSLYLRGWVFTPQPQPASEVFVLVGSDVVYPVRYGDVRWDIATHYDDPALERVGFRGIYPLAGLPLGSYDIRLAAFDADTDDYHLLDPRERFEIVESRFLFPGKHVAPKGNIEVSIDSIETYGGHRAHRGSLSVRRGETVVVRGWAVDRERSTAAGGVFALIDGKQYVGGVHGLPRHDVALALDMFDARRSGFTIRVPIQGLTGGSHKLEIVSLAADGVAYTVAKGVKLSVNAGKKASAS